MTVLRADPSGGRPAPDRNSPDHSRAGHSGSGHGWPGRGAAGGSAQPNCFGRMAALLAIVTVAGMLAGCDAGAGVPTQGTAGGPPAASPAGEPAPAPGEAPGGAPAGPEDGTPAASPAGTAGPAAPGPQAEATGQPGAAPPGRPLGFGPYRVGFRTFVVIDADRPGRPLPTAVWYPADAASGPTARYPVEGDAAVESGVARVGAAPAPGRFPLLVFSHGSAGSRVQFASVNEVLASHGFVVAAPDHPGDTMAEHAQGRQGDLIELAGHRQLDVSAVITALTEGHDPLARSVRADRVGVLGFSFGGLTAVSATVGLPHAPADRRVKAVVAVAPATEVLPAELLAQVQVPVLLIGGTHDPVTPLGRNAARAFDQLTRARPRVLVTVAGATHNSFTDVCEQAEAIAAEPAVSVRLQVRIRGTADLTCCPPMIRPSRARDIVAYHTVLFLACYLDGDGCGDGYPEHPREFPEAAVTAVS